MNDSEDADLKPAPPVYFEMDLQTYRRLASKLPVPSQSQIDAFVDFVSHAHSWYKHMRGHSTRSTLQFFMDPHAGMQRIVHANGAVSVEPRVELGFHYSWLPTQEYRERFGHLAFSKSLGTSASMRSDSGSWLISADDNPVVVNARGNALGLIPSEVLAAGAARVSGLIHTLGADYKRWAYYLLGDDELPSWPEESGGRAAMQQMRQRCEELRANRASVERAPVGNYAREHTEYLSMIDYRFYQLVEPERKRQLAGMAEAIHRVTALLAPP